MIRSDNAIITALNEGQSVITLAERLQIELLIDLRTELTKMNEEIRIVQDELFRYRH